MSTCKPVRTLNACNLIAPRLLSQLNCEGVAGMNPRRFLELLPRLGIPIATVGKLRLVQLDAFERAVMKFADEVAIEEDDEGELVSPDAVLAAIGLRRTA